MKRHVPIRRKSRIRAVNPERRRSAFARCFHSDAFVAYTKAQPCAVCHCRPSQAAHAKSRGAGGTWVDVLPLCGLCHSAQHNWGKFVFEHYYGINLKAAAEAHVCRWLREQEMAA